VDTPSRHRRWTLWLTTCIFMAVAAVETPTSAAEVFSHGDWSALLTRHVDDRGLVDYRGFAGDRGALDAYLARLAKISPDSDPGAFPTPRHALAYWLNAYNALVVRGVLDRGIDTPSVWGDGLFGIGFFTAKRGVLGGRTVDLKGLEDDVVRARFRDPRVHAALNCASISCPRLPREAFDGETLDGRLDAAMREFVAAERNVAVDATARTVTLSKIFDWFDDDFLDAERARGAKNPSVIGYVNRYRTPERQIPADLRVVHRAYDKGLNRQ
jgi:hypothetical protein